MDTDLTNLTASELMAWGLSNLWKDGQEGGYAVRHGLQPVSDFGRTRKQASQAKEDEDPNQPNFFERAFPALFPYGRGGIESFDRPTMLDFRDHVRWCLLYHDRRFRKHETFPFIAFGISQRRQALYSAKLQMRRKVFESESHLLKTITAETLEKAQKQEAAGHKVVDPVLSKLWSHIHATASRVSGSDASRISHRSKIWSTCAYLSPPSLWITINPDDLHDPIVQVFAGENIDLDKFLATLGPAKDQRARNVAEDPFAAAKFFHFIIRAIIETLFGVKSSHHKTTSTVGIFGYVAAYFGTVESQGRGTLHLHMLLWLENAPTAEEITAALLTQSFRDKVRKFIEANIHAFAPGLESKESIQSIPNETEIGYSRPPHPDSEGYDIKIADFETRVARAKQVHTCELRRCLRPDKDGHLVCKRRAPWKKAEQAFVEEAGSWGPKRLFPMLNAWCPGITINVRCNNDAKIITSGEETKNLTYYICGYTLKKQGQSYNASAVLAQTHAYHIENLNATESLHDQQRLLIFRVVHAINREQELSAPMVISDLMGWKEIYMSHNYAPIYWTTFAGYLCKTFPDLRR